MSTRMSTNSEFHTAILFFILTQEHEPQGGGVQPEDAEQPLGGRQAHSSHGLIFGLVTQKGGKICSRNLKKFPNSNLFIY